MGTPANPYGTSNVPVDQIFDSPWPAPAPPVLPPRVTSIPGPIQPLNTVAVPVPFTPPAPQSAMGTDLTSGGNIVPGCGVAPAIAQTFSSSGAAGNAPNPGRVPNLGAQALNLHFADVQQT